MNKEEYECVKRALREAHKRFVEVLEEEDYDPAYFSLTLSLFPLDMDFKRTGEAISWSPC